MTDAEIDQLVKEYNERYEVTPSLRRGGSHHQSLREGARIEVGLRHFLEEGNFKAFTTAFEGLHGLARLPGLLVQRLMAENYGFGGEGDWKTAALERERYDGAWSPYARGVSHPHRAEAFARNSPALHWRQGRPGAAGV